MARAKEVKLKMTLDETGAVVGVEKVGERFKRMRSSGQNAGAAGHAGFLKIAAGAVVALGALQLIQGAWRSLNGFIGDSINKTAQTQDEIAKLSHKIGVATETLSAYRLATKLSGTSMESLTTGLRTVAKNAYDVSQGTGEAKIAFEELGVSVTDNEGRLKDSEELMLEVADKLMLVEDSSRRTAMAQKIFGRSGTDLLPMLENGRAGLEAMKQEAHDLGITFTDETAQASEEYNDSLARMEFAFEGIKMKIGNAVIPALTQVIQLVLKNDEFMTALIETAKFLGSTLKTVIVIIARAGEAWSNFSASFYNGMSLFKVFDKQFEDAAQRSRSWAGTFKAIADGVEGLNVTVPQATQNTRNFNNALNDNANKAKNAASAMELWNQALLASSHHENVNVKSNQEEGPGLGAVFGNLDAMEEEARKKQEAYDKMVEGLPEGGNLLNVTPGIQTDQGPIPDAFLDSFTDNAEATVGALDLMKNAAMDFGQAGAMAFGQWARGQGQLGAGMRQATTETLANVAQQALGFGIMHSIMAVAALTPWGRAMYGDPLVHAKSAAGFLALAAGTGITARGMSGGEGGMGTQGTAFNPVYTQGAAQSSSQVIYMDQVEVMGEIRNTLQRINSIPPDEVLRMGVERQGGVTPFMNDNDRNVLSTEVLQRNYVR